MLSGSFVAARFLSLVAHFVITITIFWAKDTNVLACLPLQYTQTEYDSKNTELIVGLSLTIAFLVLEFGGFIGGVSMFNSTATMLSIVAHACAAISLSMFVIDSWDCDKFWYVFGFCSALPAFIEICVVIGVLGFRADK
ncbi:transmembrane protein 107-like [Actinia tenebrosa]|uniref:Transmembrane protein 107 n=1 Tax=Actinia tenebrosa TaxID=6105 RepID=A0A6P8IYT3_ACTTE|nr:transmembrane protein 107-like [Actinia tenebrosa]